MGSAFKLDNTASIQAYLPTPFGTTQQIAVATIFTIPGLHGGPGGAGTARLFSRTAAKACVQCARTENVID